MVSGGRLWRIHRLPIVRSTRWAVSLLPWSRSRCSNVMHSRAVWGGEDLFARPYNNQMDPSRPTVCAIMTLRRAAHLAR